MAPEAMEHFQFTQAADVYSFGKTIKILNTVICINFVHKISVLEIFV